MADTFKNQTAEQTRANIARLEGDIEYLEGKLDKYEAEGNDFEAESVDRILGTTYNLLSEQQGILDVLEERAPRLAAEARLAYHDERDELDIY